MIPSTRAEFKERILQELGSPIIKINCTDEQIENQIDSALYKFYERHYMAMEQGWYIITPSATDIANGYMILPDDIIGVGELYRVNTNGNIYSVDFQLKMAEMWGMSSIAMSGSLNYYYTVKMHLGLLNDLFRPDRTYDFNAITHKIVIYGMSELETTEGSMVLKCFKKIQASDSDVTNTDAVTGNIWKVEWLREYATALVKKQWAQNMSKYANIALLGGITVNAGEMKAEAKEEIAELENELQTVHTLPPLGWVG